MAEIIGSSAIFTGKEDTVSGKPVQTVISTLPDGTETHIPYSVQRVSNCKKYVTGSNFSVYQSHLFTGISVSDNRVDILDLVNGVAVGDLCVIGLSRCTDLRLVLFVQDIFTGSYSFRIHQFYSDIEVGEDVNWPDALINPTGPTNDDPAYYLGYQDVSFTFTAGLSAGSVSPITQISEHIDVSLPAAPSILIFQPTSVGDTPCDLSITVHAVDAYLHHQFFCNSGTSITWAPAI